MCGHSQRDPWWIFTTIDLIYIIKREYKFGLIELIRASPRFGVLIFSMLLSIVFLITDVIVTAAHIGGPSGINPYWKVGRLIISLPHIQSFPDIP